LTGLEATWRAALTAATALALAILDLAGAGHPYAALSSAFLAALLALSAAEAKRASSALDGLKVERRHPTTAVEGAEVKVEVRVENTADTGAPIVVVEDRPPKRLRPPPRAWYRASLPAGSHAVGSWTAKPAPGYHLLDTITVSAGDPFWLFYATRDYKVPSSIAATPLSLEELAAATTPLGLAEAHHLVGGGASPEFHTLRSYQPGDDVRLIHWPATARAREPIVREGLVEAGERIAVFLDLSEYTWVGPPGGAPADWGMRLLLTLARHASASGGRIAYRISYGEVWLDRGPLAGRDAIAVPRRDLSLAGPTRATHRVGLPRQVEGLRERLPKGYRLILLLGPLAPLKEALEAAGPGAALAILAPAGEGELYARTRELERRRALKHGAILVSSLGEAMWAARLLSSASAPRRSREHYY